MLHMYFVNKFWTHLSAVITVEPVLKDRPIGHIHHGLSRQVVFGDRFIHIEMCDILPKITGPSRQVVSHGSGLSRQVY